MEDKKKILLVGRPEDIEREKVKFYFERVMSGILMGQEKPISLNFPEIGGYIKLYC